jgi:hypothetical protein
MTEEKLKKCNQLEREIRNTKDFIAITKWMLSEDTPPRSTSLIAGYAGTELKIPESLFKMIAKLIYNEHQQNLFELEKEFWNL